MNALYTKVLSAVLLASAACNACAVAVGGGAYDVDVNISIAGSPVLVVPALASVQVAPQAAGFDQNDSSLGFDSGPAPARLTLGATEAATKYIAGTFLVVGSTAAVADANLTASAVPLGSLISLVASTINSQVMIAGHCPAATTRVVTRTVPGVDEMLFSDSFDMNGLDAGGGSDTSDSGLAISLLGINVPNLPLHPGPNTTIDLPGLGILGATLVLNERTIGGDGITTRSVAANGVHLTLNVAGVIAANVVLAHSEAAVDCGA